ncbi:hypothetical protein Bca4012_084190 [Brassica carinata]
MQRKTMATKSSRTKSISPVLRFQSPFGHLCGAYSKAIPASFSPSLALTTTSGVSSPSSSFYSNHHDNHSHHRSASRLV